MGRQREKRTKNKELRRDIASEPCLICKRDSDPCHVKTFKSTQIDTDWNMIPMCRTHHIMQHTIGWRLMIERYKTVREKLAELGWTWETVNGKFLMFHEGMNE